MPEQLLSFSIEVVERLLSILDSNKTGRTQLAFQSRLNYGACMKYVKFLKVLGWVDLVGEGEEQFVTITELGKKHLNAIAAHLENPTENDTSGEAPAPRL